MNLIKKAPSGASVGAQKTESKTVNNLHDEGSEQSVKFSSQSKAWYTFSHRSVDNGLPPTDLFPEKDYGGTWRLQTCDNRVIKIIRNRIRQKGSWRQVGWGMNAQSPHIFVTTFASKRDAQRFWDKLTKKLPEAV